MRRNRPNLKESAGFVGGTFGFAWDALKVVFKLRPDDDQEMSDFIFEKLGALALLLVCAVVMAVIVVAIWVRID